MLAHTTRRLAPTQCGGGGRRAVVARVAAPSSATSSSTSISSSSSSSSSLELVERAKLRLLERVAGLDRGRLAAPADHAAVAALIAELEAAGAAARLPAPLLRVGGAPAPAEGRWEVIYTNREIFRASPFFAAFAGVVGDQRLADSIFAFTDALRLPLGAEFGRAVQVLALEEGGPGRAGGMAEGAEGSLVSEVEMAAFSVLRGTVVSAARAAVASPTRLRLTVESTRVAGGPLGPLLDGVSVPVQQLAEAARGAGVTSFDYDVTFADQQLRVSRCGGQGADGDGQLLVHRRLV